MYKKVAFHQYHVTLRMKYSKCSGGNLGKQIHEVDITRLELFLILSVLSDFMLVFLKKKNRDKNRENSIYR